MSTARTDEKDLQQDARRKPVRCDRCNHLIGKFAFADCEIKCEHCGSLQEIIIDRPHGRGTGPRMVRARP